MAELEVIDFHIHIAGGERIPGETLAVLDTINPQYAAAAENMIPQKISRFVTEQGVKHAVCLLRMPPGSSEVSNDFLADFCRDQGNLIPFCCLNPNTEPDPTRELERCVKELGMRGLKLWPSYANYYPNDPRLYPLYAKASQLRVPVMFHTGSSLFPGSRLKYADPIHLDDLAVDFPDLTIVMAHSGRLFYFETAFALARIHPNVYMEISGLPPYKLPDYFPDFERNADKIIFGSDWPAMPTSIRENIEAIKNLPLASSSIERILGGNAQQILFDSG